MASAILEKKGPLDGQSTSCRADPRVFPRSLRRAKALLYQTMEKRFLPSADSVDKKPTCRIQTGIHDRAQEELADGKTLLLKEWLEWSIGTGNTDRR